jgi:hypothetical protein
VRFHASNCSKSKPSDGREPTPSLPESQVASLGFVGLAEALELTLLLADKEPEKFDRAAVRWHVRFVYDSKKRQPPRKPGDA